MALRYAVDTNILLRLAHSAHPQHDQIMTALRRLVARNVELCFTPQNLGEFWNVSTRPVDHNGFGLSPQEVHEHLVSIEKRMMLLPDNERVCEEWKRLLLTHEVRGVQVHDAHLAAALAAHGVAHLLTFNGGDFKRFPALIPVHPDEVQP